MMKKNVMKIMVIVIVAVVFLGSNAFGQKYVNPLATGSGNGDSWPNAYTDLQVALTAAANDDDITEIHVAQGTYLPYNDGNVTDTERAISFNMRSDLKIYGGYKNASPYTRSVEDYETILSGNIGDEFVNTDNSFHVIYIDAVDQLSLLDGITIIDGNANGYANLFGGGLYIENSLMQIIDCKFENNTSLNIGGAVYVTSSIVTLDNCIFEHNTSAGDQKGSGAAIYVTTSSLLTVMNSDFEENTSNDYGGAIRIENLAFAEFDNCNFTSNDANTSGGAIFIGRTSSAVIKGCAFESNTSNGSGGAIYTAANIQESNIPIEISNCNFALNQTNNSGGAIYFNPSNLILTNNIFNNNTAAIKGGGISYDESFYPNENHNLSIINNTFYNNSAPLGSGIALTNGHPSNPFANVQIVNSILWDQAATEIYTPNDEKINISYSNVRGGYYSSELLNKNSDPEFIETDPTIGMDFHLLPTSPCINAGNNIVEDLPELDMDGDERKICSFVDMGADEYLATNCNIIYVDITKPGGNGSSWGQAFNNLDAALLVAPSNSQIWVADGTYIPSEPGAKSYKEYVELVKREIRRPSITQYVTYRDDPANQCFLINKQLSIYGGFEGTETDLDDRNLDLNLYPTILSGNIGDINDNTDNCYNVIHAYDSKNTIVDGFYIEDATLNYNDISATDGIWSSNSNIEIWNCIFKNSPAHIRVFSYGEIIVRKTYINNCIFKNNTPYTIADVRNNAMHIYSSDIEIHDSKFMNNVGGHYGIAIWTSIGKIHNCEFISNYSSYGNDASTISCRDSRLDITNSIFNNNSSLGSGSAIETMYGSQLKVDFSTFYNNTNGNSTIGSSINNTIYGTNSIAVSNSIFWSSTNNTKQLSGTGITAEYSDIMTFNASLYNGTGNKYVNPHFVDPDNVDPNDNDFHLQSSVYYYSLATDSWVYDPNSECSECIDAGSTSITCNEPDGGDIVNIGAYGNTSEASYTCVSKKSVEENWQEISEKNELQVIISPNPAKQHVNIEMNIPEETYINIDVYDITGNKVKTILQSQLIQGFQTINWNIEDSHSNMLPNGMYLVKIIAGEKSKTHKIIINR